MTREQAEKLDWASIEKQIGKPETLEDYRRIYKLVDGILKEVTPDLPHKPLNPI